jgi:hypothetical protein
MKIATVIPVRNMEGTISRALESVCHQNPDSLLIIDDCSDDSTPEIIQKYASKYNFIKVVRYPQKADCHVEAMIKPICSLEFDYIIGLGADDVISDGIVDSIRETAKKNNPGVIFCNYNTVAEPDLQILEQRNYGYQEVTWLKPQEAQRKFISDNGHRHECGVGSAISYDAFLWLSKTGFHSLGPWMDSWGFTIASVKYGCAYIPIVGALFVVKAKNRSYHQRALDSNDIRSKHIEAAKKWLMQPDVVNFAKDIKFFM